jgi:hypothetical protein
VERVRGMVVDAPEREAAARVAGLAGRVGTLHSVMLQSKTPVDESQLCPCKQFDTPRE